MVMPRLASNVARPLLLMVVHKIWKGTLAVGSVMSRANASLPPNPSVMIRTVFQIARSSSLQFETQRFFTFAELARPKMCFAGSGDWPPCA